MKQLRDQIDEQSEISSENGQRGYTEEEKFDQYGGDDEQDEFSSSKKKIIVGPSHVSVGNKERGTWKDRSKEKLSIDVGDENQVDGKEAIKSLNDKLLAA